MAFDLSVDPSIVNGMLQTMKPVDPLDRLQKLSALRTMAIQQQDYQSQVAERNAIAQQRQVDNQQGMAAAKILSDHLDNGGDPDDPMLMQKLYAAAPKIAEGYQLHRAQVKNYESESEARKQAGINAANALAETIRKNQADEAEKKTANDLKAQELMPPEERGYQAWRKALNLDDNAMTRQQYKLQGMKLSPNESVLGGNGQPLYTAPPAPRTPVPGVDIPLPAAVATQKEQITAAGKTPPQPTVATIDDPAHPGQQIAVTVDKATNQASPIMIGGKPAVKTTAGQQNATAKASESFNDATKSLNAIKDLAKQDSSAADKALIDQYFNVIRPSTGGRMSEANIKWLATPGPLQSKIKVYLQKLNGGQPLTKEYRQEIINAAEAVVHSKDPSNNPNSKSDPIGIR